MAGVSEGWGALGPGKAAYFDLWPQYHDGTPKHFQFIDRA
jgi:hypothetical protein